MPTVSIIRQRLVKKTSTLSETWSFHCDGESSHSPLDCGAI